MIEQFAEWYRTVRIDATGEQIQVRWDSIQEYCEKDEHDILELVKVFFDINCDDFREELAEYYFNKDLTFERRNNREISLLAGCTLIELLDNKAYEADILIAIMCLSYIKPNVILPEVLTITNDRLVNITFQIRESENYQDISSNSNNEIDELSTLIEQGTWDSTSTMELVKILNRIQNTQNEIYTKLKTCKEDSNILSWLAGEWSNELDKPLNNKINQSEIALILGKELADLTIQYPGTFGTTAFLSTMLNLCENDKEEISLVDIVDSLQDKEEIFSQSHYMENTPILLAISKAIEAGKKKVWKHAYNKLIGSEAEKIKAELLAWAYRIYLECLLTKFYLR